MKTFASGLAAAYAGGSTTLCVCLRVLRTDGLVELFTNADKPVTVGGEVYNPSTGLDISSLVVQATLAVDNMELTVLPDEVSYPQVDILAGRWNGAQFWLFECDYTDPSIADGTDAVGETTPIRNDINLLKRGTTGEADLLRVTRKFEFRGLKQPLQQQLVPVMSKTCRYRLFSTSMPAGLCLIDPATWTHDYLTTAVASRHSFTCSAAVEASDYYGEGICHFNDGANAGFEVKIRSFAAGVFTLSLEAPFTIAIGDSVTVSAGCRKRLTEDCKTKFGNVLNFGGEPHVVGADLLTADPSVSV